MIVHPTIVHPHSSASIDADQLVKEILQTDSLVKKPKMYRVLILNDDYTTMEFVMMILQSVFHHTYDDAYAIMMKVHKEGHGTCGVYTYEIAETKQQKVIELSKEHEHPLRCRIEEET